ncbi:similar to Saccharomyces cerevisiae YEL060C PRB1 Vacuolar proteinase B (yscB), a serine protease of the subtilisin family [Maudiozyma barnettii]|uniref:Similar to Saccharomyces cerevisiae YEL060C PRB1 Vacuolar proteinase B (YscB), a serine protease of the subtilisin family n=1 Tax=Maudiozyma barnettii TaxID=61262 RepID=A0A8H2VET1_9SACH|nr:uncharacterized protein KABA2_04S00352 [Kazachstania barnettii]CAB4254181.1 similar to Saccharomyces cerevisiae YEL060C PRB1 Vacuolar proteinase B (yscB), a serine protease of the subtilisin family [Kazachstania barnettii]CAD1785584.1 similar to Saccharomyces cerevisiae YEL060C PRB1 Vacuolar proteinase B (yscB), a serine protease of the subtilisin family [Kazachstania barnettii]
MLLAVYPLLLSIFFNFSKGLLIPEFILEGVSGISINNIHNENDHPPLVNVPVKIDLKPDSLDTLTNKYIVVFKESASKSQIESHINSMNQLVSESLVQMGIMGNSVNLNTYELDGRIFGYSVYLPDIKLLYSIVSFLSIVASIEADTIVRQNKVIVQEESTWGLARISQRDRIFPWNDLSFTFHTGSQDNDVNVYIIDTGIQTSHIDFEGRASWGMTAISDANDEDMNGHGTHCAGIIGSKTYGVAKDSKLIAVKVLDSAGNGEMSDVLKGIEFVVEDHLRQIEGNKKLKGSVVNMSMGAGKSFALTGMINAAVKKGIHFVVAAGNEDQDACYASPSDSKEAITVGATTTSDQRAFFSNWGECVDIFAPGTSIPSTYIGGTNNATEIISGTSMSAPHVAGLVAYFLNLQPEQESSFYTSISPNQLKEKIVKFGTKDKLYDPGENSPNVIAYNGGAKDLKDFWIN